MGMLVAACTPTQQAQTNQVLSSRPGQLFCSIQLAGGGAVIAALVDAGATAAASASRPLVVVAIGQAKAFVDDACAKAAQQTAGLRVRRTRVAASAGRAGAAASYHGSAKPALTTGPSIIRGAKCVSG